MNEPQGIAPRRASGFWSLPSSGVGKWSAWLLVVSLAMILLNNLVVMPNTEPQASLDLAQRACNLAVFLCVAFAGVTGLCAIPMKRERSWTVFVAVLLFIVVVAFNLAAPLDLP